MSPTFWVAALALTYLVCLFGVAHGADLRRRKGHSPVDNPWVYSLSLGVYCTSWTFYGSVGRASSEGLGFLPIYLGPTLMFLLAPTVLRRLVRFCHDEGVTSVPDLLEALYGRGRTLGTLATFMMLVGVTPYIGLQLKAIGYTFDLLTGRDPAAGVLGDPAFWAALSLSLFAVLFGARRLVATERHEGLVAAVALESAVKLGAFLLLGAYIVWGLGGGLNEVFAQALEHADLAALFRVGDGGSTTYAQWVSLSVLSAGAVVLLPRQFHMLVVENVREQHLLPATWGFPLYLLLINLLVLPVALVGLLTGAAGAPDFFLISMPLSRGHSFLAFLAFLGGFSAATSMVIVSSVALATMILHHPGASLLGAVFPALQQRSGVDLSRPLLHSKRILILAVILLGYGFKRWIGDSHTLVNIGLLSFSAVVQFAPPVFLGLYWRGAHRSGAVAGLLLGFLVWGYTLLLPSFAESGWIGTRFLTEGPLGWELLRPRALLGLNGLDPWTHSLVWSLIGNIGAFLTVSFLSRARGDEEPPAMAGWASREDLEALLKRFVGAGPAREVLGALPPRASPQALLEATERCLAGALGTPSARAITRGFLALPRERAVEILDIFGGVSGEQSESREALQRRLRELLVLHEAAAVMSKSLHIDTVLSEVLGLIQREFRFEYLAVRLLDDDGMLRIRSFVGLDPGYVSLSAVPPTQETYFGTCFLSGEPVVVGDARDIDKPVFFGQLTETVPVTALVHAPMIHEDKVIGVLTAYGTRGPMHFTDEFVSLYAALARQLALALVNAKLYTEVQDYSHAMEEKVRKRTGQLEAANQRLEELNRLKSEFLSTVGHELRTPLTAIRSFAEILLRYGVEDVEKRNHFVRIIHDESERLTRMINNLLDLSKIEAGRQEIQLVAVSARESLEEAVEAARPLFSNRGVTVAVHAEDGLPPVLADRDALRQVLANLFSNAAKFSPEQGQVTVTVRRRGLKAVVRVADQGPGIPRDRLTDVFDRYTQVRDPQKAHPLGTGLGLSISRDIVVKMGGEIWVESEPGKGTSFAFTLPLAGPEPGPLPA